MDQTGTMMNATLSAAVGDNLALIAELRLAFEESAQHHIDLLKRSRCDGNWNIAALRLKGLAGSFHAEGLHEAAELALSSAPGDPVAVRKIELAMQRLTVETADAA